MTDMDQLAKLLENQNKLIEILVKQQQQSEASKESASKPGDLLKQSIQFDSFNSKEENFDCYKLRLENFSPSRNWYKVVLLLLLRLMLISTRQDAKF